MEEEYKTIFNFEVFAVKEGQGRIVTCRASGDDLQVEDMLTVIQMLSHSLTGMITEVNKTLLKQKMLGMSEKFSKSSEDLGT